MRRETLTLHGSFTFIIYITLSIRMCFYCTCMGLTQNSRSTVISCYWLLLNVLGTIRHTNRVHCYSIALSRRGSMQCFVNFHSIIMGLLTCHCPFCSYCPSLPLLILLWMDLGVRYKHNTLQLQMASPLVAPSPSKEIRHLPCFAIF